MKKLVKFLSVILTLTTLLSISPTALASEDPGYTVTINEYDVYVSTRATSNDELARNGANDGTVQIIKSNAIENKLTQLSQLPEEELSKIGYTKTQIQLLKNYNGERIEDNPQLRGIFADMSCYFSNVSASNTRLRVKLTWTWSSIPFLSGTSITDLVAIRWKGTNTAGQPLNLALNKSLSSCKVEYYLGTGALYNTKTINIDTQDPYGCVSAKIPMSIADNSSWAKRGTMIITVDRTGTDSIKEAAFVFAYGHTVAVISPSLSLPPSFSIGFSLGTEKMCEEAIRMSSSGVISKY